VVISISLPREVLNKIDARRASLNLPRSHYLVRVAMQDIKQGGPLVIDADEDVNQMELMREITEFMKHAVPALQAYQLNRGNPEALAELSQTPAAMADNQFWPDFLREREEILTLKWYESEKAKRDIGFERALQIWLHCRPEPESPDAASPD
jgi:hypothetical protein